MPHLPSTSVTAAPWSAATAAAGKACAENEPHASSAAPASAPVKPATIFVDISVETSG
jgi:hypothetical protein